MTGGAVVADHGLDLRHIGGRFYLIGFKNKVTTLLHWVVSFLGRGRAERIAPTPALGGSGRPRAEAVAPAPGAGPRANLPGA